MALQAHIDHTEPIRHEIAVAVLCSLATVVVLLRLLSRKVSKIHLWWDDAFIIIATVFAWATAAALFWAVSVGLLGIPDEALDIQAQTTLNHINLFAQNMYYCCIAFIKFSILTFYLRLFPISKFRIATYALIGITAIWWVPVALISILGCTPIEYNWDRTQPGGHCIDARKFILANAIPNIVTDLIILLLPLPVIWHLQLHFKKKLAVSAILSLGIFVTMSSCIRLAYTIDTGHLYGDLGDLYLWSNIEPDIAIICACLPIMMPLIRLVRKRLSPESILPSFQLKALPPSLSHRPHRKKYELGDSVLNTDRDGISDDNELASLEPVVFSRSGSQVNQGLLGLEEHKC